MVARLQQVPCQHPFCGPSIGVAKRNVKTVLNANGSADVTFEFNLENFGNVNLNNITLIDNLAAAFPASCVVTVMTLTSDDFTVDPAFNGTGNNNMLAVGNDLPVGDKGAVLLTVNVANCGVQSDQLFQYSYDLGNCTRRHSCQR